VNEIPRFPRLVPAASPTPGAAPPIAPNVRLGAYMGAARLIGAAGKALREYQDRRATEEEDATRAELEANPELINELLEAAPDDPEAQQRIVNQAVASGLLRHSDSPYFQDHLLEAKARGAANKALLDARSRLTAGEHLPREDENGVEQPGLSADEILDQELAKYRKDPTLTSRLGAASFQRILSAGRPVLQEQARSSLDARNVENLVQTVGDELSTLVRSTQFAQDQEVEALAAKVEERANSLREAGISNFREVAAGAILRGVTLLADRDPDRALLHLNTVVGDLRVGGQSLEDNPRTASMLATARERVRKAAEEDKRLGEFDRARAEREQLRSTESEVARYVRELKATDLSGTEIRRKARSHLEVWVTGKLGDPEFAENSEILRREGLKLVDAIMSEDSSDPQLVDEITGEISLATSADDLAQIEGAVRAQAGLDLFGRDLEGLMDRVARKRTAMLTGYASDPTYSRGYSELREVGPPSGLPEEIEVGLGRQMTQIDRDWADEVAALVGASASGQVNPSELSAITRKYQDQKIEIRDRAQLELAKTLDRVEEAVNGNASAAEIRARFGGKVSRAVLQDKAAEAQSRRVYLSNLAHDPVVRAELVGLLGLAADTVDPDGFDPFEQARVQGALQAEFENLLREEVTVPGTDIVEGRPVAQALARRFVREHSDVFRKQQAETDQATVVTGEAVGRGLAFYVDERLEGEERVRASLRAPRLMQDADRAAALVGGGDPITAANHPFLAELAEAASPEAAPSISSSQEDLYASGFSRRGPRSSVEYVTGSWMAQQAKAGGKELGGLYVAGMSPVGIPFDVVAAGKAEVDLTEFGLDKRTIKVPVDKIPPFSTPLFMSVKEFEKAWTGRKDELDKLLRSWGITKPEVQQVWRDTQIKLIERLERAMLRNGK